MKKFYNGYANIHHFFDMELLNKLNYDTINEIFYYFYVNAQKRWKGNELDPVEFTYYSDGVIGWDHAHYADSLQYTPKISVENEVKFIYEMFRFFRYEIEEKIKIVIAENNTG